MEFVMLTKPMLLLTLLLLTGAGDRVLAQEYETSLALKISNSIQKNEPGWKFDRQGIIPNRVVIRWLSEKGHALVSVNLYSSEAEADKALKSGMESWAKGQALKGSKAELRGVGDVAYLLDQKSEAGKALILLKQGKSYVEIFGPSKEDATRFAKDVSVLLPSSGKPTKPPKPARGDGVGLRRTPNFSNEYETSQRSLATAVAGAE
jgi:hypothetical protein